MDYVWITGPSAIGKYTLANRLADPNNVELRDQLCIADPVHLLGYAENLERLAAFDGSKTALIIWQAKQNHLIDELAELKPAAAHRIILVWRPFDQHLAGYKEKRLRCYPQGFTATTPEDKWIAEVRRTRTVDTAYVLKHSGIGITVVDASAGYRILPEWPSDA